MNRPLPIFAWTAVLTHLIGVGVTGHFNPVDWPRLLLCVLIVIVAPCLALAMAVIAGAVFEAAPTSSTVRGRFEAGRAKPNGRG